MTSWKLISSAPKEEELLLGHNPKWYAPLPMYWSEHHGEWRLVDTDIDGAGKKFGIMLSPRYGQPTHWDYCPIPPAFEETK